MHLLVFGRLATLPWVKEKAPLSVRWGAGAALWALLVAGRVAGHGGSGPLAAAVELAGMAYLGALFLATVCLLPVELVTVFGLLLRGVKHRLRAGALVAGGALSLLALVQGVRPPVVEGFTVRLKDLPPALDGTVVVGISDLHLGSYPGRRWMKARVEQVARERPDLVVLLGDVVEGHGPPDPGILESLSSLSAPLGVWAVPGNHEFHRGEGRQGPLYPGTGICELRDRFERVLPGLGLAGVRDAREEGSMARAVPGGSAGAVILLSHLPFGAEEAEREGVGLMLSGHTHGGQLWPFGLLEKGRFPLMEGRYQVGGMAVIVCRGTGTWGPPMRLWRPGQILRITLRSGAGKVSEPLD